MTQLSKPQFMFRFTAAIRQDSDQGTWVSWCPELNLFSQGTNFQESLDALGATALSWIKYCYRRGILDDSLIRRGWSVTETTTNENVVIDGIELKKYPHTRALDLKVPLYLVAAAAQRGEIGDGSCSS